MKIPMLIAFCFAFLHSPLIKAMDADQSEDAFISFYETFFPKGPIKVLSQDNWELRMQLQYAISTDAIETIALFLAEGGNVEESAESPSQQTLLLHACLLNKPAICKLLIDAHANPNATDEQGRTPLMLISNEKICKMLLDAGARVNARDNDGRTPLIEATDEGICKLLLDANAEVNALDNEGRTALMAACNQQVCTLLLNAGARVNDKDKYGGTALFTCASKSNEQYSLLLQAGADVNVPNDEGETALFRCLEITDDDPIVEDAKKIERYRLLLDARADINARCELGHTVLIEEINQRNERLCEFLLAHGASVHIKANDGTTPLIAAARSRNKAICKMLVNHHKEIDRGLIAALHYLKHIKNPFLRFLYSERKTLLRPYLQQGTLAAQLKQRDDEDKCAHDLFHLKCLVPQILQFSNEDSADDSDDGIKNDPFGINAMMNSRDPERVLRWKLIGEY
jgi:ankyrin repeat protein